MVSIRTKLTLWYVGSFMMLLMLSFLASEVIFQHFALRGIDAALLAGARRVEHALPDCFDNPNVVAHDSLQECFERTLRSLFPADVVYAQLVQWPDAPDAAPTIVVTSAALQAIPLPLSSVVEQIQQTGQPLAESLKKSALGRELRLISLPLTFPKTPAALLQIGIQLGEQQHRASLNAPLLSRADIFLLVFPALFGVVSVAGYVFMKAAFAPIHQVATLAKHISAEDLSHRIDSVKSKDEIGELAETFNAMIARLESSFQQIQQFSSDVAHELKTPLTVLKGELEVALRKERSAEEYRAILMELLESTNSLGKMVEDLLFLARMDAQRMPLNFAPVALDELALNVYENVLKLVEAKHLTVNLNTLEQVTAMGDLGLLERVIKNVLINAINYTPEGGSIDLSVTSSSDSGIVTIRDTGIGIPAEAVPHIFDRFYRVDQSRSHDSGGTGLGLAIVKKIVDAHYGTIDVRSQVGAGTTVQVCFPRVSLSGERPCFRHGTRAATIPHNALLSSVTP